MAGKKNNLKYYTPLPKPVAACKWEKMGDHPLVGESERLDGPKKNYVFRHEGVEAFIEPGDYIVGPDETGLYTVFHGAAFENLYELARAGEAKGVDVAMSKFIGSTYGLNMLSTIEVWFDRNRLCQWAQQTHESQNMFEYMKFLQRLQGAIKSERT